ncbi:hypothetical protein HL42_4236 [Trichophyton rubrum]|nr:hypothetical protein HL42_4236 [Trichophyton rubrum]
MNHGDGQSNQKQSFAQWKAAKHQGQDKTEEELKKEKRQEQRRVSYIAADSLSSGNRKQKSTPNRYSNHGQKYNASTRKPQGPRE